MSFDKETTQQKKGELASPYNPEMAHKLDLWLMEHPLPKPEQNQSDQPLQQQDKNEEVV